MSQRPTLDPSSFERLLAAAWLLQRQHEQEAHNRQPAPDETLAEPPETHVEAHCVSERDTKSARLMPALSKLSKAAEVGVNQNSLQGRGEGQNTEGKGTEGQAVGEVQQMRAVAIRKGQSREKAAGYPEMGTLRCEGCGEEFFIGHHPAFVDKRLADKQAHWLERVLAEEHERDKKHSDLIELPD